MFEQESTLICLLHCRFLCLVNPVRSLADDYLKGCLWNYREVDVFRHDICIILSFNWSILNKKKNIKIGLIWRFSWYLLTLSWRNMVIRFQCVLTAKSIYKSGQIVLKGNKDHSIRQSKVKKIKIKSIFSECHRTLLLFPLSYKNLIILIDSWVLTHKES